MKKTQGKYEIISNQKVCGRFFRLSINAQDMAGQIEPGQFIHIRVADGLEPFFRRPFSIFRAKGCIEILYEVVGHGTLFLSHKKKGDMLDVLGPLGRPFCLPKKGIKKVFMIAGGVGVAPFLVLSDALKEKGYQTTLLYGGRTKEHFFDMRDFKDNGCIIHLASDDGSVGVKGRVSELFSMIKEDASQVMIYTCGPRPMMKAVQDFAKKNHFAAEASCEEVMACGLGACLGCAIKTTAGYKMVCHDGPVFDLQEIVL